MTAGIISLIMLSQMQQKDVWERWLAAETRANYFADLSGRFAWWQTFLTWTALFSSSGAAFAIVSDSRIPARWSWIKPVLAVFTAAVSLLAVVTQNQKRSSECSDLHFKWNRLSTQYEALWNDMYSSEAQKKLESLIEKGAELSKSAAHLPYRKRLMERWEDHVIRQHAPDYTAATA
jgi:hypothetical protein